MLKRLTECRRHAAASRVLFLCLCCFCFASSRVSASARLPASCLCVGRRSTRGLGLRAKDALDHILGGFRAGVLLFCRLGGLRRLLRVGTGEFFHHPFGIRLRGLGADGRLASCLALLHDRLAVSLAPRPSGRPCRKGCASWDPSVSHRHGRSRRNGRLPSDRPGCGPDERPWPCCARPP